MKLKLSEELGEVSYERSESPNPAAVVIIAHGAGAGMHHPFMMEMANELCTKGFHVVRFNFPYMEQGRKSPGSPKKNIETWKLVIKHTAAQYPKLPMFLSGKSYGGRMASHLLAENTAASISGIIYFGFPLHAPGRDSIDRAAHLKDIALPQLFLQGEKDKLANIDLISEVTLKISEAQLIKIADADHSFHVPKRAAISKEEMIALLASHTDSFIKSIL